MQIITVFMNHLTVRSTSVITDVLVWEVNTPLQKCGHYLALLDQNLTKIYKNGYKNCKDQDEADNGKLF